MAKGINRTHEIVPFRRSVHLELDYRNEHSLDSYMLTAGARRVLGRLIPSLTDAGQARAWTLTGPYGTGKSAFSVFVAQLLAPKSFAGHIQAKKILREGDEGLSDLLPQRTKQFRGLWPVAIAGSRESIPTALLRGLRGAIVDIDGRTRSAIQKRIVKLEASIANDEGVGDREILEIITDAATALASNPEGPSGLFFIIDEMGKLLEFAAAHPTQSDVYILQHLQELAARSDVPILLLTILHKDFIGYADRLSTHERAEWDKVRGRFEDIVFEESADEILRLVAMARSHAAREASVGSTRQIEHVVAQAWKLQLAPAGMARPEFTSLLLQCWPLHPLVSVLAGPVFRKLAQNERSVFSFLSSQEPHGLVEFLLKEQGAHTVYAVNEFYDYLWTSIGEGLFAQRNGKKWAEIDGAIDRLPDGSQSDIAVLKAIGLLNVVGGARNLRATADVIRFALEGVIGSDEVTKSLRKLENSSTIVSREYNGTYALWEGSDVDIDDRVKVARDRLDQSEPLAKVAARYISLRPIVARKNAFQTGTLRYFSVHFIVPDALAAEMKSIGSADGRILIVLPTNAEETAAVNRVVKSEQCLEALRVLVAIPAEVRSLDLCVRELAGLEWVRNNTPELSGDLTARRELRARTVEIRRQLDVLVEHLLVPATNGAAGCSWYYAGKPALITTKRSLNDFLSECCKRVFSKTPRLLNELVNRRELSSAAAAARRNLIEWMIARNGTPDLGIVGFPPEKSIYLSTLATSGIYAERNDGWTFGEPDSKADYGVKAVWKAIQEFFDSTEHSARTVEKLFDLLRDQPFGLRDGPIPLLLCAALIASDSDVALYENGSFIPQLTITVFERLMKHPGLFTLRRWRIGGVRAVVFRQLAEMLGKSFSKGNVSKQNVLDVVRPLMRFVSQLPEHTQKTELLSEQTKRVRAVLSQSREADELLFVELPKACGANPFDASTSLSDRSLQSFITELKSSLGELQRHYETLLADLTIAIGAKFGISGSAQVIKTNLSERAISIREWAADPSLKNFVERASDLGMDERTWGESLVALLSERPPSLWRDTDRARFDVALSKISRLFQNLESLAFSGNKANLKNSEAVRIGITTREAGDVERVIHVAAKDKVKMNEIEGRLRDALQKADWNGNKDLTIAAVARLAKNLLA